MIDGWLFSQRTVGQHSRTRESEDCDCVCVCFLAIGSHQKDTLLEIPDSCG